MPVTARELADSRRFSLDSGRLEGEVKYVAFRSDDEAEIAEAVFAEAPPYIAGLALLAPDFDPQGGGVWFVTCRYGLETGLPADAQGGADPEPPAGTGAISPPPPPPPPPPPTDTQALYAGWAFSVTGGTAHIVQSLETVERTGPDGLNHAKTPKYNGLIGVTKDGPQGCDIQTGALTFSTTRHVRAISLGYMKSLARLSFTTNDAQFWTFAQGELLFAGASGTWKGPKDGWEITYNFAYSENVPGFSRGFPDEDGNAVPDFFPFTIVRGHNYVWFADKVTESGTPPREVRKPFAAYCERVYRESDFALLGLGV